MNEFPGHDTGKGRHTEPPSVSELRRGELGAQGGQGGQISQDRVQRGETCQKERTREILQCPF